MSIERVETFEDLELVAKPDLNPPPLLEDVREGRVHKESWRRKDLFVCSVPLIDGSILLLKGTDAIIASLFGGLENGGVIPNDVITSITTLRKQDVARRIRKLAKRLVLAGVTIREVDDRTGFSIHPVGSFEPNNVDLKLERSSVEDAFSGIHNLQEPNYRSVLIFIKKQLVEKKCAYTRNAWSSYGSHSTRN